MNELVAVVDDETDITDLVSLHLKRAKFRVKAVLRRKERKSDVKKIEIGDFLEIDLQKYRVELDEKKVDLTRTEFQILRYLASKTGWVFTREEILELLWGNEKYVIDRIVDVHIRHLRSKLGNHGSIIKNVRGVGYKLEL